MSELWSAEALFCAPPLSRSSESLMATAHTNKLLSIIFIYIFTAASASAAAARYNLLETARTKGAEGEQRRPRRGREKKYEG